MNYYLSRMSTRQLLLLSSSNVHGFDYLAHSRSAIEGILNRNNVKKVLFVPFAGTTHDDYTNKVEKVLMSWGYSVEGLHKKTNQSEAILEAEAIFIGGGNTFLLLRTLYENNLILPIRKRILEDGVPYIGSSAGTNIATRSIETTNDMPILYPPSFEALTLVPFNINPHYLDPDTGSKHRGETREQRINEFHEHNNFPVLGLREGTALLVENDKATIIGSFNARLFQQKMKPIEYEPNSDVSFLLLDNK